MRGFSLVELLVVLLITAIISVLLVGILSQTSGVFISQNNKISQGLSLNASLEKIARDTKIAASIEASYPSSSPTYQSASNQIILKLPATDTNGDTIAGEYDYIVYYIPSVSPKILKRKVFPSANSIRIAVDEVLMTDLKLLQITYLDDTNNTTSPESATNISVFLSSDEGIGLNNKESNASTHILLRNN